MKTICLFISLTAFHTQVSFAGDLAELYKRLVKDPTTSSDAKSDYYKNPRPDFGIEEIGIEKTACFLPCPEFTAILRLDGSVEYDGEKVVARLGKHRATVSRLDFDRLAEAANRLGIWEMDDTYSSPLTDMPTVYIYLKKCNKQKVIRDYGLLGPAMLDVFRTEIDRTLENIIWDDREKTRHTESLLTFYHLEEFSCKDESIENVLKLLSEKTKTLDRAKGGWIEFSYSPLRSRQITLTLTEVNVRQILDVLMLLTGLKYYVAEDCVVVSQ